MADIKSITISIEVANSIVSYLGQRPFIEVHNLIAEIQRAAAVSELSLIHI